MPQTSQGLFGKVKFVVYVPDSQDKPNLSDVYLNIYDMVENDFFNNLAKAFSICGLEKIGKDFFKSLGQDFLTIGQDIIDSQYEGFEQGVNNKVEIDVKKENIFDNIDIPIDTTTVKRNESGSNKSNDDIDDDEYQDDDGDEHHLGSLDETMKKKAKTATGIKPNFPEKAKEEKSYACPVCQDFTSTTKKHIDEHIISLHKDYKKYACTDCEYKSNFQMNLKRHIDIKHKGLQGDHFCSYCPKRFFSPAKLKSHILVHTKEKNFVCEECAAEFKRKDDLKSHLKIHEPDDIRAVEKARKMVHVCDTCGKKFEKNWKLQRHMVVHNKN